MSEPVVLHCKRIEAFSFEDVRNAAIIWIETEMIRTGLRQWTWQAEHLGENNYELTFRTYQEARRGKSR